MPAYEYVRHDTGEYVTLYMTIAEMTERQAADGSVVLEDGVRADRVYAFRGAETEWGRPIHSEAMAVHPDQIGEAQAFCARKKVPTEYDRMGNPILTSRSHRRRFCRAWGVVDHDGGDRDAT